MILKHLLQNNANTCVLGSADTHSSYFFISDSNTPSHSRQSESETKESNKAEAVMRRIIAICFMCVGIAENGWGFVSVCFLPLKNKRLKNKLHQSPC